MKNKFGFRAALFAFLFFTGSQNCAAGMAGMAFGGLSSPTGMVYAKDGSLFVSEWSAGRIVMIKDGSASIILDGLDSPAGLAFDSAGNLYIAGYGDGNIYVWNGRGKARILASGFASPTGLLWDEGNGALLVANRNAGEVVEVNGAGDKRVISSEHRLPVGVARAGDGSLFVSCYGGSVDIIAPDGGKTAVSTGLGTPGVGIVPAGSASAHVVDYAAGNIAHVSAGVLRGIIARGLPSPVGLAIMPDGNLLVGCWGDGSLRVITIKEEK